MTELGPRLRQRRLELQRHITLLNWPLPCSNLWAHLFFKNWGQVQAELFCASLLFAFSRAVPKSASCPRHEATR